MSSSKSRNAEVAAVPAAQAGPLVTRFVFVHGDKGGVGKSMVASVLTDQIMQADLAVAVIDADTRNPDVIRMFKESNCEKIQLNLRVSDGWMDVMDFVHKHPGHTFIVSTPAGIGENMKTEFDDFVAFLRRFNKNGHRVELHLWWVLNHLPDSVNLLNAALEAHPDQFDKIVVVRNNVFGLPDDFIFWNESTLKSKLEAANKVSTVDLPALHLRVMKKLFDPQKILPYSLAMKEEMADAIDLMPSERAKLESWFVQHVPGGLGAPLRELTAKAA